MSALKKVSVLGILTGAIAGVLGRTIGGLVIGFFIGLFLAASGVETPEDLGYLNPVIYFITFLVTSLASILGGYIAAYIAKHDELLNGALSSFLMMVFAVCSMSSDPLLLAILTLITSPLLALFGGYIRLKQKLRKQLSLSGGNLETGILTKEPQPEQAPIDRSSKPQGRTGKASPLILLGGIAIVVGVIWCLWFGWSLASFTFPGFIIFLGYGIFRLFRKGKSGPSDGS